MMLENLSAGMLEDWKPLAETDVHQWWHTFDINVRGEGPVTVILAI